MNLYDQISSNKRKTFVLLSGFFALIIFLGYVIGINYGNEYFGIVFALIAGVIYFLISYYGGAALILNMTGAVEATKPEYAYLINSVEGLAIAAGLPKTPKVYVIDDTALNAFATGRDPEHASVTVTTGLLSKLNRLELEGVIAHEMAHIKNSDIKVMLLASVLVGLTVLLSDFLLRTMVYGGRRRSSGKGGQATGVIFAIAIILALLTPLIAKLIKLAVSRNREFLADSSGALLTRYPKGLADALRKIANDPDPLVDRANKATAHLFISSPFQREKTFLSGLFSTHPDINERIKILEGM